MSACVGAEFEILAEFVLPKLRIKSAANGPVCSQPNGLVN